MSTIFRIHFRRLASILLFLCLFLPLSKCAQPVLKQSIPQLPDGSRRLENIQIVTPNGDVQLEYVQLRSNGRIDWKPKKLPPNTTISDVEHSSLRNLFFESKPVIRYPIAEVSINEPDTWFWILTFCWPVLIWLMDVKLPNQKKEPYLLASSFFLWFLTGTVLYVQIYTFQTPMIGWYLSAFSLGLYMISLLFIFASWCYSMFSNKKNEIAGK